MATRHRRESREEKLEEKVLTVGDALSMDRASVIYERIAEVVREHGADLLLKIRLISSDYRTAGFLTDVSSTDEIQAFIENPEGYLKSKYGEGSYRIDFLDGVTKKYVSHIKIDISSLKEQINKTPDYLVGEVTKAYKEGVSLGKSSSQPNNNQALDLTKLMELVMLQQEKAREREEKTIERIREQENKLRAKELELLEKVYSNNFEVSKQFQPIVEFMSQSGRVLGSAMTMLEKSANFMHTFSPQSEQTPFWERILVALSDRLLNTNPQLLEKLLPMLSPQLNTPKIPNIPFRTIPIENNQNTEIPTQKKETPGPEANKPGPGQASFEQAFQMLLFDQLERANLDIEADFAAECLLTNLEVLSKKQFISPQQLDQAYELLTSPHLEDYIKVFYPDIIKIKAWFLIFQTTIKENLTEPQEDTPKETRQ